MYTHTHIHVHDKHSLQRLTSVDDLVPFQVTDTVEDSATNFTWMDVPLGQMRTFDISNTKRLQSIF